MSSWQPDSPVERPDGSLVCKAHGLVVCGVCTVDYSFMLENLNNSPFYDVVPRPTREQTLNPVPGVFPTRFRPSAPTDIPSSLFTYGNIFDHHRFVRRTDSKEILIFTDGACLDNGKENPRAGCGFVFRPQTTNQPVKGGSFEFRLESRGPSGDALPQTSNRAELRAVIAALQYRAWDGEGWNRIVIATDSEYTVKGATEWIKNWQSNGWRTSNREPVKNKDSWELLLKEVRFLKEKGVEVVFWWIPRELNGEADAAAKRGAQEGEQQQFVRYCGVYTGIGGEMMSLMMPLPS
ncbi:ribonuclease H-like protein [Mollisia scopiformis]|uniref:ribonuclease H n=1 Tax=Mollisia scopiformis TaxID=149040 RepID=A0A194WUK5_MOLSC|nr:ribonuclease H-like protein [Mollisia scopiformis]KUJ11292.1 ribonuclease H-like protein [Mollisia scopiformis]